MYQSHDCVNIFLLAFSFSKLYIFKILDSLIVISFFVYSVAVSNIWIGSDHMFFMYHYIRRDIFKSLIWE